MTQLAGAGAWAGAILSLLALAAWGPVVVAHLTVEPRVTEIERARECSICLRACQRDGTPAAECLAYCQAEGACR